MVTLGEIPEFAICPRCGQPFKVVYLEPLAAELGRQVPEGSFVLRCCNGVELTLDDEPTRQMLKELLLKYHRQE
jgi:hypothetical protein